MATTAVASTAVKSAPSLWSRVKSVPIQYPFAFGVVLSGFKTSFSDLLVQKVVEQKEQIDWRRNAAFATFGFVYLGGVQYSLYVKLFGRVFPGAGAFAAKPLREKLKDARGLFNLGAQVFLDQAVHHPLLYFPAFYCTKELVMNDHPDLGRVLRDYRVNMKEDLLALWKVWLPTTILNFAFMPMWARIPWVAGTSLIWTCILSAMRGGDVAHGDDMALGSVTGATLHMMEDDFRFLFTQPVKLESNKYHMVITASGVDKMGLTALLSRVVADGGGNVTHSKMVRLGCDFIVQMHVSVDPKDKKSFMKLLRKNPVLKGLSIQTTIISRRETGSYEMPVMGVRVRCVGKDKPGMLASISESLAEKGLNIENIATDVQMDRDQNREFVINADCVATSYMDQKQLESMVAELSSLKKTLDLDVVDVRVQRLVETSTRRRLTER